VDSRSGREGGSGNTLMAPIHILHVSHSIARGGVEEYILTLLRRLDRRIFGQCFVCTPTVARLIGRDAPDDVEVIPMAVTSPLNLGTAWKFARILRQKDIGILHSHQFRGSLFASPIGRLRGVPVVMETPHIREYWRTGRKGLKGSYAIDRMVARFVDQYVAVSLANARYLTEEKGIPAAKIRTIHFGSDLSRFDPGKPATAVLRCSLGFAESDVVLAVIGRLEPQKGHAVLLEALQKVRAAVPNVRLACIGEGRLRNELETRTRDLGLGNAVRFVGFQKNIPEWLAMADISVLPSFFEGLPLTAIESSAAGRPVIGTAVDGTPEVVLDGRTGILVPPGDAGALARAIRELSCDPALRHAMGEAGSQWVFQHFSEDRFIRQSEDLYLQLWAASTKRALATRAVNATRGRR